MDLPKDVREGLEKGRNLGLWIAGLAAVRWFVSLARGADVTSIWTVFVIAIGAPALYGAAGAGTALLNRLADRGTIGQILTGIIVGAGISLLFVSFMVLGDRPPHAVVLLMSPIVVGFMGGIAFAAFRKYRGWRDASRDS